MVQRPATVAKIFFCGFLSILGKILRLLPTDYNRLQLHISIDFSIVISLAYLCLTLFKIRSWESVVKFQVEVFGVEQNRTAIEHRMLQKKPNGFLKFKNQLALYAALPYWQLSCTALFGVCCVNKVFHFALKRYFISKTVRYSWRALYSSMIERCSARIEHNETQNNKMTKVCCMNHIYIYI